MTWKLAWCLALGSVVVHSAFAASQVHLRPPLWVDRDDRPIPEPKRREISELFAITYNTWLRHLSPAHRASGASDPGALNVNAWDEVPDSSWFSNRLGRRPLSFEEILNTLEGNDPAPGAWEILSVGNEGYTPSFYIRDTADRSYYLKFDLPTALERNSAAERICTLVMHAAGYHVPHNSIVYFRRTDLVLTKSSFTRNPVGKRRPMTPEDLTGVLQKLTPMPDGRYRGLASMILPGKPVGRFMYTGRRKDDPNDLIPHQLRRELRGMRVIAAWINHADVGDKNTFDAYDQVRKFIRHYLLDFGSAMGSGNFVNGPYRVGHEYIFDGAAISHSFLTLGIWQRPWEVNGRILYPEVGYFQAELFEPQKWRPNYPNLAFERMDEADAYWGAKIVTAFSDDLIDRLVASGEYSRAEVATYVADVLKKRRDIIGNYWLNRITPLEEVSLEQSGNHCRLRFRDLAVERRYAEAGARLYRFWLEDLYGRRVWPANGVRTGSAVEFPDLATQLSSRSTGEDRFTRTPFARILIQSRRPDGGWALPVATFLGHASHQNSVEVLGWSHSSR